MDPGETIRLTVNVTRREIEEIKAIATLRDVSPSQILREGIYMRIEYEKAAGPLVGFDKSKCDA